MADAVRIVAWNCNSGLRGAKSAALEALAPDLAVVPEAANTAQVSGLERVGWTGKYPYKGLAVFARPELHATVDPTWVESYEWFLPIRLPTLDLDILAVWAMNQRGGEGAPRWRTRRAFAHYAPFLARGRAVVLGDFNDNLRWDRPSYPAFAGTLEELGATGYASVHHARSTEQHGAETTASLYWRRDLAKPYLVDHVFVPAGWLEDGIAEFQIGPPDRWLAHSDHMPLVLDLRLPLPGRGVSTTIHELGAEASPTPVDPVPAGRRRAGRAEPTDSPFSVPTGEQVTGDRTDSPSATPFRIATWNMNHWQQPTDRRASGWNWLGERSGVHVALLQETVPPPSISRERVVYHEIAGRRPWGSAVVALRPGIEIEEIWSVSGGSRFRHRVTNTHPGSVAVARVHVPGIAPITVVSVYNVLDGSPTANVLRVIADLVPLLDSVDGDRLILGGDFNIYGAVATGRRTRAGAIFGLLTSLGLQPVGSLPVPRPAASTECPCGSRGTCGHIPTWNGLDLDHLFVTERLASQVVSLAVDQAIVADESLSDHAPLILDLALSAAPVARPWDAETFVAEIGSRFGAGRAAVVQSVIDWAGRKEDALRAAGIHDRKVADFELPPAIDPSMFVRVSFFDRRLNPQWLFSLHSTGDLQVSFQYMTHPPFDTAVGREPIRAMLNRIEGVDIAAERLGGRPRIPLDVLQDSEGLRRLLEAFDVIVDQTRPTPTRELAPAPMETVDA